MKELKSILVTFKSSAFNITFSLAYWVGMSREGVDKFFKHFFVHLWKINFFVAGIYLIYSPFLHPSYRKFSFFNFFIIFLIATSIFFVVIFISLSLIYTRFYCYLIHDKLGSLNLSCQSFAFAQFSLS